MKYLDILHESKKSMNYINNSRPDYTTNHLENVKNMLTVKEGTALAGSFCNLIMEVARNYNLDMEIARGISNRFQRVALDSKHTTGVKTYTDLPWHKLRDLLFDPVYNLKNMPEEKILEIINNIIDTGDAHITIECNTENYEDVE